MSRNLERRDFLLIMGAGFGMALTDVSRALPSDSGPVTMKSWDFIEAENNCMKRSEGRVLRLVATNGCEAGIPFYGHFSDITPVEDLLRKRNLLDPESLYDELVEMELDQALIRTVDTLAWDLKARTEGTPLHAVWGTKQKEITRYGDVRWRPEDTPESYAIKTKEHLSRGLLGTKLHFPGASGSRTLEVDECIAYLRATRETVGPDYFLAWDPHPGEAATNVADALKIVSAMEELNYEWLEGPVPPGPLETRMPEYRQIRGKTSVLIEPEGSGADTFSYEALREWTAAGACDQWHYDCHMADGITQALRIMRFAEKWSGTHPDRPLRINLHWSWTAHMHLIAAFDKAIAPYYENPWGEEVPEDHKISLAKVKAPSWPGVYQIDALNSA